MANETEVTEIEIDRGPDAVWAVVREFGEMSWLPGVESVTVEGDIRTVTMMGMSIEEKLINLDDEKMQITYGIVGGPVPIEFHEATISVVPAGDGTRASWAVTAAPEGTAAFMSGMYATGLEALKAKVEG